MPCPGLVLRVAHHSPTLKSMTSCFCTFSTCRRCSSCSMCQPALHECVRAHVGRLDGWIDACAAPCGASLCHAHLPLRFRTRSFHSHSERRRSSTTCGADASSPRSPETGEWASPLQPASSSFGPPLFTWKKQILPFKSSNSAAAAQWCRGCPPTFVHPEVADAAAAHQVRAHGLRHAAAVVPC